MFIIFKSMNDVANVNVHLRSRRGNVNINISRIVKDSNATLSYPPINLSAPTRGIFFYLIQIVSCCLLFFSSSLMHFYIDIYCFALFSFFLYCFLS